MTNKMISFGILLTIVALSGCSYTGVTAKNNKVHLFVSNGDKQVCEVGAGGKLTKCK